MTSQIIYQINKEDLDDRIRQLSGDQLLKKKDAAELISVSLDTFDRLVADGEITPRYDQRVNVARNIVRYSKMELLTKTFGKIRRL